MTLERRLRLALWLLRKSGGGRHLHEMTPEEGRTALRRMTVDRATTLHGRPRRMANVHDAEAPAEGGPIGIRIYRPMGAGTAGLVYFHGGGFVTGGIDEADVLCRRIAAESGRSVCSVAYRLAPEHRFPAAVDDAVAALDWVADQADALGIDRDAIAVGGDSAGATLAAAVTQLARDAGGPAVERQVLIYGGFDLSRVYPSAQEMARAPILNAADAAWCVGQYVSGEHDRLDPRASPLLGDLHGLPPALVIVAEYDPLRDEGEAYSDALRAAGNEVELQRFARQPHGFLLMGRLSSQSGRGFSMIGHFLRR